MEPTLVIHNTNCLILFPYFVEINGFYIIDNQWVDKDKEKRQSWKRLKREHKWIELHETLKPFYQVYKALK